MKILTEDGKIIEGKQISDEHAQIIEDLSSHGTSVIYENLSTYVAERFLRKAALALFEKYDIRLRAPKPESIVLEEVHEPTVAQILTVSADQTDEF